MLDMTTQKILICLSLSVTLLLSGCSPDRDWQAALKRDTVDGYKNFLEEHHDSAYNALAEQRMAALKEQQSWTTAQRLDSVASYQAYLAAFPNGLYVKIASARIETLNKGGDTPSDMPAAFVPDHQSKTPTVAAESTPKPEPAVKPESNDTFPAGAATALADRPPQTLAQTPAVNTAPATTSEKAHDKVEKPTDKTKAKSADNDKDHPVRAQVGVFSKHEGAETARNQAQSAWHSADANFSILELDRGDHKLWRVATNPLSRENAHVACEVLHKHNLECAIVGR